MSPSTPPRSIESQWALTTAAAFAITIVAHELGHGAVLLASRPFTPAWRSLGSLAGPVTSLLIVAASVVWTSRRDQSPRAVRWAVALGLTAAVRVFLVWLIAGPWLLGWAPEVTFDERAAASWLGVSVVMLLAIETVVAGAGAAWLIRRMPGGERRAALAATAGAIALLGIVVFLVNPRI